jgi:hypothetical protein
MPCRAGALYFNKSSGCVVTFYTWDPLAGAAELWKNESTERIGWWTP